MGDFGSLTFGAIFFLGFISVAIVCMPFVVEKALLYCPACQTGKFFLKKMSRVDPACKKCGERREWIAIPEELRKKRIKYVRVTLSLLYPLAIYYIISIIFNKWFSIPILLVVLIISISATTITGIVLALKSQKEIFRWAQKNFM